MACGQPNPKLLQKNAVMKRVLIRFPFGTGGNNGLFEPCLETGWPSSVLVVCEHVVIAYHLFG